MAGLVARMDEEELQYRILVGKSERKLEYGMKIRFECGKRWHGQD